jgi:hypothetical protein
MRLVVGALGRVTDDSPGETITLDPAFRAIVAGDGAPQRRASARQKITVVQRQASPAVLMPFRMCALIFHHKSFDGRIRILAGPRRARR